jgi:alpha-mannosidase
VDRLQLAIAPVDAADLRAGSTLPELWEDVFLPPRAVWLRQATRLRIPDLDVRLDGPGLVLSAIKPAEEENALVLRCYNARPEPVDGLWHLGRAAARAVLLRADERGGSELALSPDGRTVPFRAGPRAIVTIAVFPAE